MSETIRRTIRTFLQGAVAILVVQAIPPLTDIVLGNDIDLDALVVVGRAAVAGGVIALITFAHNALEATTGHSLLKPDIPAIQHDAYRAGLQDASQPPELRTVRGAGPAPESE